jgi:hypothetical protein
VDRVALQPHKLYWRVRAVYATFGVKKDSVTSKPLFNAIAWSKAKGVLSEILEGFYSDPPTETFYHYRLRANGEIWRDALGLVLLKCNRGTNSVENTHKHLIARFGTSSVGFEMADHQLAEFRHRHNHRASIKNRRGFPRIGHYDTWLVDAIQVKVWEVHTVLIWPGWSNSSDYIRTKEDFGIVPLADWELVEAINGKVEVDDAILKKMPRDFKYMAKRTGLNIPALPWHGEDEFKLYPQLVLKDDRLTQPTPEELCFDIIVHVNGTTVFPKIPVYNRLHQKRFERNGRIRDAVLAMLDEIKILEETNLQTLTQVQQELDGDFPITNFDTSSTDDNITVPNNPPTCFCPPLLPREVAGPIGLMAAAIAPLVAGRGVQIRAYEQQENYDNKRTRGTDRKLRKKRTCKRCQRQGCVGALAGRNGKGGSKACTQETDADGNMLVL